MSKPAQNTTVHGPIIARFPASRVTYIREHVLLAALGSVLASGILMLISNPNPWVGIVAAVSAILVRGVFVFGEATATLWLLTDSHLLGPGERAVPLGSIKTIRPLFSAAQVVTHSGDKYMLKYLEDTKATIKAITDAKDRRRA